MGDVAMTVPVIKNVLQQNPQVHITFVSNAFFKPMFEDIERCSFIGAQLKTTHKGFSGIYQLYKKIAATASFDGIADLHNSLRSRLIRFFFSSKGLKTAPIDKGRKEKKALTRKKSKLFVQLTPMHERYADVFRQIKLSVELDQARPTLFKKQLPLSIQPIFNAGKKIIGIAPFAQHQEKMYPIEKMRAAVEMLAAKDFQVLLFGSKDESPVLEQWANEIPAVYNLSGKYSFADELAIISNLQLMVSMDSANMHLASLFNIPVVSIWGATHPFAGFYGWAQNPHNIVSIDLYCRPCSVFGNKPCYRGDHACMQQINEWMIVEKIMQVSEQHSQN